MDCWIEIIREDGTLERQLLEGERITVGRSPGAGIPIVDARDLEPEHLMIAPRSDGCWVAVAQGASPVRVRGEQFNHGMLAWKTEIEVGNLRLKITDELPKEKKDPSEKKVSAPVLIAAFVLIPLVGWLLLSDPDVGLDTTPTSSPPELFEENIECPPNRAGGTVRHQADTFAETAIAKAERYPFSASDGVEAVILYAQANACYRSANQTEAAAAMARERELMEQRINEDYVTHRLRLTRSIEQGRLPDALLETRALIALLSHMAAGEHGREDDHPYLAWLKQLERQLQLAIDAQV